MKCKYGQCKNKIAPIKHKCSMCTLSFCSTHRLPEDHACIDLNQNKEIFRYELAKRLISYKTIPSKL